MFPFTYDIKDRSLSICDKLLDFATFAQFEKSEKHQQRIVTFSKLYSSVGDFRVLYKGYEIDQGIYVPWK